MAKIIVYDSTTGAIKRIVRCPAGWTTDQVGTGEAQIAAPAEFDGDDTTHEVVGGEVAVIT